MERRELLRYIRRLSIEEQRDLVRKAARGPLTPAEVRIFIDNAQHALAGADIADDRIGFLAGYGEHLEEALLQGTLSRAELAFVLVTSAFNILYGGDDAETSSS